MLKDSNNNIQPLLDLFDRIQAILQNTDEIDLPRIIVCGNQSSGKSSVLESIAQILLPRGSNIVTRLPISIQMRNKQTISAEISYQLNDEYVINQEDKNKGQIVIKLSSFDDIDKELRNTTQIILEKEGQTDITTTQIILKLEGPQLPNLTLIDLPGITCPNDRFKQKFEKMYRQYMKNPSTIILIVTPAQDDLTNTQACVLALEADPKKERTIGVVTKIDNYEKGFASKINNNDLNYKLGLFLVRNRTPKELEENISYEEVRRREQKLLEEEEEFQQISSKYKGTLALLENLIKIQNNAVINERYRVKEQIETALKKYKEKLAKLPESLNEPKQKHKIFQNMLHKLQQDLDKLFEGKYSNIFINDEEHERARIDEKFDTHYQDCLKIQDDYLTDPFRVTVEKMIKERKGINLINFHSTECFQEILQEQIPKILEPTENLCTEIFEYLRELHKNLIYKHFQSFQIKQILSNELKIFYEQKKSKMNEQFQLQIKKESKIICTKNPLYLDVLEKLKQHFKENNVSQIQINDLKILKEKCSPKLYEQNQNNSVQSQTTEIQLSVFSYINTLFKRLLDNFYCEILYQIMELSTKLYDQYISLEFLSNSTQDESNRKLWENNIKILTEAKNEFIKHEKK